MPIRSSSPKAVRNAMKALAAAVLVAGGTAVPATAYQLDGASDAAQRSSVAFAPGVSDAAQRTATTPVAFAPGVSDAAQRTAATPVAFGPGVSDAAQAGAGDPSRTSYGPMPVSTAAPATAPSADDGFDWWAAVQGLAAGMVFLLIGAAAVLSTRRLIGHA